MSVGKQSTGSYQRRVSSNAAIAGALVFANNAQRHRNLQLLARSTS